MNTAEDFRILGAKLRNWGRWGPDDERGTTNLITPTRIKAAARLIRHGKIFDLGIPLDTNGPQTGTFRINPVHLMSATGAEQLFPSGFRYADDYMFLPLQAGSQWDSLAHVYYDNRLYNGFLADTVTTAGAKYCSIDTQSPGIAGRAVLLDIAALHNKEWLEAGTVITPADLEAAIDRQGGVPVGPGDTLLIRTGWRRKYLQDQDRTAFMSAEPGLGQACCTWLRERDVAAIASDNWALEVLPFEPGNVFMGIHMILIRDMGMTLGEMLDLEALAEDCATDGVWEFFFTAPPLKVTGGIGSPVNPLAIK